jgi:hypothetical protein
MLRKPEKDRPKRLLKKYSFWQWFMQKCPKKGCPKGRTAFFYFLLNPYFEGFEGSLLSNRCQNSTFRPTLGCLKSKKRTFWTTSGEKIRDPEISDPNHQ